jgi:hypothetical protein
MMPAWDPVYDAAGYPASLMARDRSDMAMRSPAVSRRSSSRGFGEAASCPAMAKRSSVVWPIADTTTTTSYPDRFAAATRSATARMRPVSPTEVPPYFWTITATARA